MVLNRRIRRALTLIELLVVLVILVALAGIVVPLISQTSLDSQTTATRATLNTLRQALLAYSQDMTGVAVQGTTVNGVQVPGNSGMPFTLADLQRQPKDPTTGNPVQSFDPVARRGWRGPYLQSSTVRFPDVTKLDSSFTGNPLYGILDDPAFVDGWGNPVVLQWPTPGGSTSTDLTTLANNVRLVSAGAQTIGSLSKLDTRQDTLMPTQPTTSSPALPNERGNDFILFIRVQDLYP